MCTWCPATARTACVGSSGPAGSTRRMTKLLLSRRGCGTRSVGFHDDAIARTDLAVAHHARVDATHAWLAIVVHAVEVTTDEPSRVLRTRCRVCGHLGERIAERQPHAGAKRRPVDAGDTDVLAGVARRDRVALGP